MRHLCGPWSLASKHDLPCHEPPHVLAAATLPSPDPGADESPAPVRVALVLPSLAGAGAERQMLSLATSFDRARIDPTVIALKEASMEFSVRAAGLRTWSPTFGKGVDLAAARRLAAYLRQSNFDVVMCANQYATLQTLLARRLAHVTVQVWSALHSSPGHIGSDLRSKAQQAAYRRALRSCAGLIYVSDLQRQVWEARGFAPGVPAVVINNGIDAAQFATSDDDGIRHRLGWSSEDYVVGICAHLRPEKRVEDLVRAVRLLLERGLPARLLIVGEGPCRVAIEAACREQLGAGTWALAGMQHRVAPFIQACDVMALVSEVESFSDWHPGGHGQWQADGRHRCRGRARANLAWRAWLYRAACRTRQDRGKARAPVA